MKKNTTLEASSAEDDRREGARARPITKASARRAMDPSGDRRRSDHARGTRDQPGEHVLGNPVEAWRRPHRDHPRCPERHKPREIQPDGKCQPRECPGPRNQEMEGRPDQEGERLRPRSPDPIVNRIAASAGRRGATTTAAIPAAVAPTVADWNAHGMWRASDPSRSMTAIAPSTQAALVSRRTTT